MKTFITFLLLGISSLHAQEYFIFPKEITASCYSDGYEAKNLEHNQKNNSWTIGNPSFCIAPGAENPILYFKFEKDAKFTRIRPFEGTGYDIPADANKVYLIIISDDNGNKMKVKPKDFFRLNGFVPKKLNGRKIVMEFLHKPAKKNSYQTKDGKSFAIERITFYAGSKQKVAE